MGTWIEGFSEMEKMEYHRGIKLLRDIFRNGPIYGDATILLIKEIIDKRSTGSQPAEKK